MKGLSVYLNKKKKHIADREIEQIITPWKTLLTIRRGWLCFSGW